MRHHDQRRAGHGGGRCQQLHHLVTGCLVQCPGGLVGEDGTGATHQRPGDRDPLGLTAGHLRRAPPPEIRQAEPCEHLIGGAQCRTRRCSGKHERKSHVLPSRQLGDELAVLKDESQLAQSQMGSLRISETGDLGAPEAYAPLIRDENSGQAVQQGRLARARGPHDRDALTCGDVDSQAGQSRHRTEALDNVAGSDQWCAHGSYFIVFSTRSR